MTPTLLQLIYQSTSLLNLPLFTENYKQLLDEAEYDMKNYSDRGGCYPPKPEAEVYNTLRGLHNSSYHTKGKFDNCFINQSKYFQNFEIIKKRLY